MKAKQFFISLLAILTLSTSAVGLTACNGKGDKPNNSSDGYSSTQEGTDISSEENSSAEEEQEKMPSVGLEYTLSDDGTYYIVTGIGTCTDTDIVIASTYENLPVTSIGDNAFSWCENLTNVTIGDSVTSIGDDAFEGCNNLQFNEYGDAKYLGNESNPYCFLIKITTNNISSFTILKNTKIIATTAFLDCNILTSITIDENNAYYSSLDGNLYNKDQTTLIQYAIGKQDTSFTIPDSVTSIGERAFSWCRSLTSVEIPDSVTSIGPQAFHDCSNLTSVVIPDSVTSIGYGAFEDCSRLTSITFEGTVAEWNAIQKGNWWNEKVPATEVVCSDGTVTL